MHIAAACVALVAAAGIGSPASAQTAVPRSASEAIGSRVRVTYPKMGRLTGTLVESTADTIIVNLGGSVVRLGTKSVRRLDVSRGQRKEILQDAALGFAVGYGLGAAITALKYADDFCASKEITGSTEYCAPLDQTPRDERRRYYTRPIATVTTLFGAVVGYVGRERWSRIALDSPRRVGLTVERDDVSERLGVAIPF
jgi:hypothetical protein